MHSEGPGEQVLLMENPIARQDVYQRQQGILFVRFLVFMVFTDTLITWTELDGRDFSLSFQDIRGCSDIWYYFFYLDFSFYRLGIPLVMFALNCWKPRNLLLVHVTFPIASFLYNNHGSCI